MLLLEIAVSETEPEYLQIELEEALNSAGAMPCAVSVLPQSPITEANLQKLGATFKARGCFSHIIYVEGGISSQPIRNLLYCFLFRTSDLNVIGSGDVIGGQSNRHDLRFCQECMAWFENYLGDFPRDTSVDLTQFHLLVPRTSFPRVSARIVSRIEELEQVQEAWAFLSVPVTKESVRRLASDSSTDNIVEFGLKLAASFNSLPEPQDSLPRSWLPTELIVFSKVAARCKAQLSGQSSFALSDWSRLSLLVAAVFIRYALRFKQIGDLSCCILSYTRALELACQACLINDRGLAVQQDGFTFPETGKAASGCGALVTKVAKRRAFFNSSINCKDADIWKKECHQFLACRNNTWLAHGYAAPSPEALERLHLEFRDLLQSLLGREKFDLVWDLSSNLKPRPANEVLRYSLGAIANKYVYLV